MGSLAKKLATTDLGYLFTQKGLYILVFFDSQDVVMYKKEGRGILFNPFTNSKMESFVSIGGIKKDDPRCT